MDSLFSSFNKDLQYSQQAHYSGTFGLRCSLSTLSSLSYSTHSASSSRTQVPGQAARAVARLTSGVVSTVVHHRPWLAVAEVTQLVTRHQPDQPVAGRCRERGFSVGRRRSPLPQRAAHRFVSHDHTVPPVPVDLADPLLQAVVVCARRVRLVADGGGLERGPNPEP